MTTLALKAVTTMYRRALPDQLRTIPLAGARCNTPIDPILATYYNYNREGYFALSCLELKDNGDIKEIEEGETFDELGKKEP